MYVKHGQNSKPIFFYQSKTILSSSEESDTIDHRHDLIINENVESLGNSANTDLIRQAKREPRQVLVPTPTLETNENVEYEVSELRLILYQIAIGISMHLAITAIFISIPIITMENKPRVVIPRIVDYNQYGE